MNDHRWDAAAYAAFHDLRLRPALDLLARVSLLGAGYVIDLGCGSGAVGGALRTRFPERRLIGVDASPDMLAKAAETDAYDTLTEAEIAAWSPDAPPALIFSNAALHWLDDHHALLPRLFAMLGPGGVLAVQMPAQLTRMSHQTMIEAAASVRPDLFTDSRPFPGPLEESAYPRLLPDAQFDLWASEYFQWLEPVAGGGHPVRAFVSSTGGRPILSKLDEAETAAFTSLWDQALDIAYPRAPDGGVWFPFRRVFFTARRRA